MHLLLQTAPQRAEQVADLIRADSSVERVDVVSGPFDLVVLLPEGVEADALIERCVAMHDVLRVLPCRPIGDGLATAGGAIGIAR